MSNGPDSYSHTGYYYFASPYSDPDPGVRKSREEIASRMAAHLTALGLNLFAPITQSERIKQFLPGGDLPHHRWMEIDIELLRTSKGVIVYMMDGWKESKGVTEEIKFAEEHGLPIFYLPFDYRNQHEGRRRFVEHVLGYDKPRTSHNYRGRTTDSDHLYYRHSYDHPSPSEILLSWMEAETKPAIIPGVKDSSGKDAFRFIPYEAQAAIARVREYGNQKYQDPAKWYQFDDAKDKFVEAAQRHIAKYQDAVLYKTRSEYDEESGLHHLDHAICTLALAIALRDKPKEERKDEPSKQFDSDSDSQCVS